MKQKHQNSSRCNKQSNLYRDKDGEESNVLMLAVHHALNDHFSHRQVRVGTRLGK